MNETLEIQGNVTNEVLTLTNSIIHGEMVEVESCHFCESIYGQRMIDYYPKVISCIQEYRAIIESEFPEIEALNLSKDGVLNDAWLLTMGEDRVSEWEKILGISPLDNSTVDDRRDTIIARIRGQGKLNTALISSIVNAFTGGSAKSWVENSVLYVSITPPPNNKQYKFDNVKQEIEKKIPVHLGLEISRNYFTWNDINNTYSTWDDMKTALPTWEDVYLFIPFV